jgi:hypothetical protein
MKVKSIFSLLLVSLLLTSVIASNAKILSWFDDYRYFEEDGIGETTVWEGEPLSIIVQFYQRTYGNHEIRIAIYFPDMHDDNWYDVGEWTGGYQPGGVYTKVGICTDGYTVYGQVRVHFYST